MLYGSGDSLFAKSELDRIAVENDVVDGGLGPELLTVLVVGARIGLRNDQVLGAGAGRLVHCGWEGFHVLIIQRWLEISCRGGR